MEIKRESLSRATSSSILVLLLFLGLLTFQSGCAYFHMTPLGSAAREGDIDATRTLIATGVNLNDQSCGAGDPAPVRSPMQWAALKCHSDIVRMLIDAGADVSTNSYGWASIHDAVICGDPIIVKLLLDNGANINAVAWGKWTPLNMAIEKGNTSVVKVLLDRGANINAKDLQKAQEKGYTTIARILEKASEERYSIGRKSASLATEPTPTRKQYAPKAVAENTLTLPAVRASLQARDISQRWAVIVGVSNYQDSRIPSLRYASADAQSFYRWLTSSEGGRVPPSRVKLLINEEATGRNIKEALFVWLKQAIEEDLVIIFFAGHGSPESPDYPDNLFLLPYDAQYDNIATTGFPMWDVETALKRFVQAKKVVVMADACHAGGVGQAFDVARRASRSIQVNPISSGLHNLSRIGDGVCVISGSDDKQFSQESRDWGGGHGVFTYFLLEGLKGQADYNKDSRVTLGELIPYLSEQVRRETRNAQSPTVAGKFDPALSIAR